MLVCITLKNTKCTWYNHYGKIVSEGEISAKNEDREKSPRKSTKKQQSVTGRRKYLFWVSC